MRPYVVVICFEDASRRRFLMARHRERGWELPGGGLEPGEAPGDAAEREFLEETGHALDAAEELLAIAKPNGLCHVFTGIWGQAGHRLEPEAGEAIVELRFVSRLGDVSPLAFPDDPYDEMARALGARLR